MIEPDHVDKWRPGLEYDRLAAVVIGLIAILGAFLGVVHTARGLESGHANLQASRIAADIEARIGVAGVASGLSFTVDEVVLLLRMEGADRALAAKAAGVAGESAVGTAMADAADELRKALDASLATESGSPVDSYVAGLLNTTDAQAAAVGAEFTRQYELAAHAGALDRLAVLGLSFLALAGVLTGLAAVLKEGLTGWIVLQTAAVLVGLAALLGGIAIL